MCIQQMPWTIKGPFLSQRKIIECGALHFRSSKYLGYVFRCNRGKRERPLVFSGGMDLVEEKHTLMSEGEVPILDLMPLVVLPHEKGRMGL